MSKTTRGLKIVLMCVMNPHRVFLAFVSGMAIFGCWLSEKLDDGARAVGSFASKRREQWPIIGRRIANSLSEEYKAEQDSQRKEQSRRSCEAILPASQRSNQK
ncbi:MAG: hypothetical protein E7L09_05795 [Enterobacteriaceae bacterium]|nr:hypothetical protein [Enterobacteriaceae bacterium]